MLYSKGGIYHAIYHWYIAIYKVVYTVLFNTAPLLCYKLFNTARCYVTSYLTLLYNMLNHTFWPAALCLPACQPPGPPLPWMRPFCSAVFIHRQTRPWPHHHHHQHHPQAHHPPPQPPSQGRCCCPRWALRSEKHGEPGPELARHVLVEALVLFPVKVLVILGEARVQRFPRVCRLEVGCCTHQGFNVGHKVLGDIQGLGKRNGVLGGLAGWEIRRDERLDVVHGFWGKAPHALLVAYRGKDLSEKRKLHPWKLLADINLACFCHAGHCMLSLAWIDQPPKHWRTKIYTWQVSSINHVRRKHTKEFLCSTSIEIIEDDPPFKKRLLIRS